MADALIGYTGFVGSNLARQRVFEATYNSSNIESIRGRSFDTVVCAGVRAEKWIANANPEKDRAAIERLLDALATIRAERFVLISTVDVFAVPRGVDESSTAESPDVQPYGRNRRWLEQQLQQRFDALVLRLPGLYGPGLKKNVIYDFLHDNETHKIDSRGVFQFYGVDRLWQDIGTAFAARLSLVHLVTEPVSVRDVTQHAFGIDFVNEILPTPASYDLRTLHSTTFGGAAASGYIADRTQVLDGIRRYVTDEKASAR